MLMNKDQTRLNHALFRDNSLPLRGSKVSEKFLFM